jgi:hypothetical protein
MCCESRNASKNISKHTTLNQMVAFTLATISLPHVRSHDHSKLILLATSPNPPSSSGSRVVLSPRYLYLEPLGNFSPMSARNKRRPVLIVRAGGTGRLERGRATRRVSEPQRVPSVGADGMVAGCSPQPCASQLGNQKPLFIQSLANTLDMVRASSTSTNEQLQSGGKCVSYSVQTDAQTLSTAIRHP